MAKIIQLITEHSNRQSRIDKIKNIFGEAVENTVPLMVIKALILVTGIIMAVLLLLVGVFPDPAINKIVAVLALVGALVFYVVLGTLYCLEKKTGLLSSFLKAG